MKKDRACNMTDKRKGSVQIRFEILEFLFFADKPQLRTHLWRKATDASYDDFLKHLVYLKDKKFVEETVDGQITLTLDGRNIYKGLRDALPSLL
jgi:predicted transcriptional regulator